MAKTKKKKSAIVEAVSEVTAPVPDTKNAVLRALARRPLPEPKMANPLEELRRLCREHANWTKTSVSLHHMGTDRTSRTTGELIPCLLPEDVRMDLEAARGRLDSNDELLKRQMARALKQTPIWNTWLSGVAGIGEIVGAQLVGAIEIDKATKPSSLKLFTGVCPDTRTGRLVRRTKGDRNRYNASLRTCLYQAWTSILKNAGKATRCARHESAKPPAKAKPEVKADFKSECWRCPECRATESPYGQTNKYLQRWEEAKFGILTGPRYNAENNTLMFRKPDGTVEWNNGGRAQAHKIGLWKSCDVFVEDLYVVWRALEGLDVWPDYYDARRGYMHGGQPLNWTGPRKLSVDEAIEIVGDVGWHARATPPTLAHADEDEAEELDLAAE